MNHRENPSPDDVWERKPEKSEEEQSAQEEKKEGEAREREEEGKEQEKKKQKKEGMEEAGKEKNEGKKEGKKEERVSEKMLIYRAKIEEANLSSAEKKKLLDKLAYVESKKIGEEFADKIEEVLETTVSAKKEALRTRKKQEAEIEFLAKSLGIHREVIKQAIERQEQILQERALFLVEEKAPKWKKWAGVLGRAGIYVGAGIGLSALTGGVTAGVTLGAARMVDAWISGRRGKRKMRDAQKIARELWQSGGEGKNGVKKELFENVLAELAVAKQEQIENKEKKYSKIGEEILKTEKEYEKTKSLKLKEKLESLYKERRNNHLSALRKYLLEKGELPEEEIEKRIKLVKALEISEEKQRFLEVDVMSRKRKFLSKLAKGTEKVFRHPLIRGGKTQKARLVTAGVFSIAGIIARACPIARNVLLGYAGMRIGEAGMEYLIRKKKGFEVLRKISAADIIEEEKKGGVSRETLARARAQLFDEEFRKKQPEEYAKLREKVFEVEREKLGNKEERVEEANENLEKIIRQKISKEKQAEALRIAGRVGGFAAGFFAGEALAHLAKAKHQPEKKPVSIPKEQEKPTLPPSEEYRYQHFQTNKPSPEPVVPRPGETPQPSEVPGGPPLSHIELKPEIPSVETVEKGDTLWSLAERQAEKHGLFDDLGNTQADEAKKIFIIDALKDKIAEHPLAYGIHSGDPSLIQPGEKIDFAAIFSNDEIKNRILEQTNKLTAEQIHNILQNKEFLQGIFENPSAASNEDITKAVYMMGGEDKAPIGLVDEMHRRIMEKAIPVSGSEHSIYHQKLLDLQKKIAEGGKGVNPEKEATVPGMAEEPSKNVSNVSPELTQGDEDINIPQGIGSEEALQNRVSGAPEEGANVSHIPPETIQGHKNISEGPKILKGSEKGIHREMPKEAFREKISRMEGAHKGKEIISAATGKEEISRAHHITPPGKEIGQVEGAPPYVVREPGIYYNNKDTIIVWPKSGEMGIRIKHIIGPVHTYTVRALGRIPEYDLPSQGDEIVKAGAGKELWNFYSQSEGIGGRAIREYSRFQHDYNLLLQENKVLQVLESSKSGVPKQYAEVLRDAINNSLQKWVDNLGVETIKKLFKPEFLERIGIELENK